MTAETIQLARAFGRESILEESNFDPVFELIQLEIGWAALADYYTEGEMPLLEVTLGQLFCHFLAVTDVLEDGGFTLSDFKSFEKEAKAMHDELSNPAVILNLIFKLRKAMYSYTSYYIPEQPFVGTLNDLPSYKSMYYASQVFIYLLAFINQMLLSLDELVQGITNDKNNDDDEDFWI